MGLVSLHHPTFRAKVPAAPAEQKTPLYLVIFRNSSTLSLTNDDIYYILKAYKLINIRETIMTTIITTIAIIQVTALLSAQIYFFNIKN